MNKKGEDRVLSPWLLIIFTIISVFIVVGILFFYSLKVDVRREEAITISNKIVSYISEEGYFNEEVLEGEIIDLACLNTDSFAGAGDLYFNLTIYDDEEIIYNSFRGNRDFEIQCRLNSKHFAKCYWREFYLLNSTDSSQEFRIKLLTASNSQGAKL
jgi:hypothetical protein